MHPPTSTRPARRTPLSAAVDAVTTFQDRLVDCYFVPHSVTLVYWSFAAVFLYLGLQKVVPHRSTADVQLATIGGLLGLPYVPFVAFIGAWQLVIGLLFLRRRIRACAWFFLSYQVFTFGTLVVLWRVVFQPPWLPVAGLEIPWALGSYSAFVLKNLIFTAVFFVLASDEFARAGAGRPRRINAWQDYLVANYFRPYGIPFLYLSYGFVWFYFGFQKPAPVLSPVRTPLADFFPHFMIPVGIGMLFIGLYEMTLGILFFLRDLRVAFWLFFPHQAVAFLTLIVIPFVAFQPPWIEVLGLRIPWALTGYGAFVVKNAVFVAGFVLLASHELGTASPGEDESAASRVEPPAGDRSAGRPAGGGND